MDVVKFWPVELSVMLIVHCSGEVWEIVADIASPGETVMLAIGWDTAGKIS